ncbi:hypothetical protein B0H10DRAFT_2030292 [Mycena sp. CBHHK59/15]|nr:hypothetical protein B0H10DRAFT_2030292 [Mycena sp. CBHHK59/15]
MCSLWLLCISLLLSAPTLQGNCKLEQQAGSRAVYVVIPDNDSDGKTLWLRRESESYIRTVQYTTGGNSLCEGSR